MDGWKSMTSRIPGLFVMAVAALVQGCVGAPDTPRAGTFEWAAYANEAIGISLEYPDAYKVEERSGGRDVSFKLGRSHAIRLSLLSAEEGKNRGLWFDRAPAADVDFAGRPGKRYEYIHGDGPFGSPVLSFVIPHRGRWLALEFRTMNTDLDAVQRRILESCRLE